MNFDKLIKNAAKTYKSGEADKLIQQAGKTANRMFDEFVPEKTKEHDLVKGLKGVADELLSEPKTDGTGNQSDDPLVDTVRQGIKGARKTAKRYADKIDTDMGSDDKGNSGTTSDITDDLLGTAEKLGKSFFSKRRK